jgi:hypothetical protein
MIAPKMEPEYLLTFKNNLITRNILPPLIKAGIVRKLHSLLMKMSPEWEI